LLGIDTGTKASGDQRRGSNRASPLETLERSNADREEILPRPIERENVVSIAWLPMHTDGREGVKAREARAYGDWLGKITGLPVEYADERFTTVHAESALWDAGLTHRKRKDRRDRVAAQIMLQAHLENHIP
jgi:putative Holliday junction resolvase